LKLIGCENFGPRVLGFLVKPTSKGGLAENFRGLKNCAFLMPWSTKVLSTSFSLLVVPWTEDFGYEVTFLDLLNF
jgi:hypothetical protein